MIQPVEHTVAEHLLCVSASLNLINAIGDLVEEITELIISAFVGSIGSIANRVCAGPIALW